MQVILKPSSGNSVIIVSPIRNSIGSVGVNGSRFSACGARPASWMILQNSRELPSAIGGSFASSSMIGIVNAITGQRREHVLDGVDFHIALGERRGAVGFADIFHARLDFRLAFEIHAAEAHAAVGGRGQDGHVHPVAAVQADAGKTGGTIKRLLVEHGQIRTKHTARLASGRFGGGQFR